MSYYCFLFNYLFIREKYPLKNYNKDLRQNLLKISKIIKIHI